MGVFRLLGSVSFCKKLIGDNTFVSNRKTENVKETKNNICFNDESHEQVLN